MVLWATTTGVAYFSQFFSFGRRLLEGLQGYDYIVGHNTKSADLLLWLFSSSGAQLLAGLFLVAFLVTTIRTFTSFQRSIQGALPLSSGVGSAAGAEQQTHALKATGASPKAVEGQGCPDTWLHEIAAEQANSIQAYIELDGHVCNHRLVGDNPYIDFIFRVESRCVYKITLNDEVSGYICFGNRRLNQPPVLFDNSVKSLRFGEDRWFTIHQPLTPAEAADILTDVPGQFGLYGLHASVVGSPGIPEPARLDWGTGPVIDKEFIKNHYPKLEIQIEPLTLRTYFRNNDEGLPHEPLGTIVNLQVRIRNPRPLKIRHFKLVTSGPVLQAETGKLRGKPSRSNDGRHILAGDELYPNLADQNIDVDRDNVIEGWLQFIVRGVDPGTMLNPEAFVVRLHVVDDSGEEHRQDVLGLTYRP